MYSIPSLSQNSVTGRLVSLHGPPGYRGLTSRRFTDSGRLCWFDKADLSRLTSPNRHIGRLRAVVLTHSYDVVIDFGDRGKGTE